MINVANAAYTGKGTNGNIAQFGPNGQVIDSGVPVQTTITTQSGTSYTLQQSDCNTTITFTSSNTIKVTMPGLLPGCDIKLIQLGIGQVTVTAGNNAILSSAHQ